MKSFSRVSDGPASRSRGRSGVLDSDARLLRGVDAKQVRDLSADQLI